MENCLPVCSTYVLWQSGQVSLYTPDMEYLSCARSLCVSRLANVCGTECNSEVRSFKDVCDV